MASVRTVRRIGATALIVPSLDHVVSPILTIVFAPFIMKTMFGAGWVSATIFFIVLGAFQLFCIGFILKSNNTWLLALGVLSNLVSIFIYFVSTSGVKIFGVPPQPLIAFGVLIKALEEVFVLASVYVLKEGRRRLCDIRNEESSKMNVVKDVPTTLEAISYSINCTLSVSAPSQQMTTQR